MLALGYILALLYGGLCIGISALVYKFGVPKKYTRKIVHILIGFEWVILYLNFGVSIHFSVICILFTLLLLVDYKRKLIPMMSSDGDNAPGTVFYGISMSVMSIISLIWPVFVYPFGIAVFCTSFGDGLAGVFGSLAGKFNFKVYKEKTIVGAISNFVFSLLSVIGFSHIFGLNISVGFSVVIALLAVGLELIGDRGLDNILLPLGVSAFSSLVATAPHIAVNYVIPVVLTPFIIALALGRGILTKRGTLMAVVLDLVVSLAFGNFGLVLLLSFLLLSVVVDKCKKRFMKQEDTVSEKGEKRDELQVLANGMVAMFMAIFYLVGGEKIFAVAYCAALAEAFSDTCASGFGAMSRGAFDIFKMKKVKKGMSGGMSLPGTLASVLAAFAFSLIPLLFGVINGYEYLIISLAAALGAFFDTFLGSVLQAKYKCTVCGEYTEKRIHHGIPTGHSGGVKIITNDAVNLLSTLFAAGLSMVFFLLII